MSKARKRLAGVRAALRGDGGRARPAYEAAGLSMLSDVRTAYVQKARGNTDAAGDKWKDISPITKLLRPGPKVSSWSELESQKVEIGRDRAVLYQSLTVGAPGSIFQLKDTSITVGTNIEYARRFQLGGRADKPFVVTNEMYARARKRVAKPRRLTKKQRSAIAKGENPQDSQRDLRAFNRQVFGVLFGMQATSAQPNQVARHILPEPRSRTPKEWITRASTKWWQAMARIVRGI
jgi:hypothetical protein